MITASQKYELLVKLLGPGDMDRRGANAQFWCPYCKHPDPKKRKLAVRLSDGVVHCWVCNRSARSPARLAPIYGAYDLVASLQEVFGDGGQVAKGSVEPEPEAVVTLPDDFELAADCLERGTRDPDKFAALRYLELRGVDASTMRYARLGLSNRSVNRRRVLFPSFDADGALNYVTARAIDERTTFRYFNTDRERSSIVFNEADVSWSRELTLVEGPFDLLACCGTNAAPMLGSWIDEKHALFNRVATHRTPVVLAFDPDAGKKQEQVARRLLRYDVKVRVVDWSGHPPDADPSKVGRAAFRAMVKRAKPFDEAAAFRSRLERVLGSNRLV